MVWVGRWSFRVCSERGHLGLRTCHSNLPLYTMPKRSDILQFENDVFTMKAPPPGVNSENTLSSEIPEGVGSADLESLIQIRNCSQEMESLRRHLHALQSQGSEGKPVHRVRREIPDFLDLQEELEAKVIKDTQVSEELWVKKEHQDHQGFRDLKDQRVSPSL
ncbi:unnamed protein product [Lota lota]